MELEFRKSVEAIVLSKGPASVVVNEHMDIVHIHGDIAPFLEVPHGNGTHNLIKIACEGLAFELHSAIHKATKEHAIVIKENIQIMTNEKHSLVTIEIIPFTDTIKPHSLICFEKINCSVAKEAEQSSLKEVILTQKGDEEFEVKLSQTREDMLSVIKEMDASNKELQSANEELQTSNEEMQRLNEELENSKEKLHATNEELIVANHNLIEKQNELKASQSEHMEARRRIEVSEREQKKMATQFKLATDSAKVGIWSLDVVSAKLEWSGMHKIMWGYDEHCEALTYEDWYKVLVPEDKELAFQKIEESKKNQSVYEVDYRIKRANDGVIVWIKSTGQYHYDEFGTAQTLTGISIDITEQKNTERKIRESEARSRALIESNVVPVCFTHMQTATIFEANNAYLNMLGYTQQDLEEGKINCLKYTPAEHHKSDHVSIENEKSIQISPPYEKEIIRTDGKIISVIKARAIINKDVIMSVFVDITERKIAEQKLKTFSEELVKAKMFAERAKLIAEEEKAKAEMAMKSKQHFLSNMSHEIRTPMNAIVGFTKVLLKTDLTEKQKEFLTAIKSSGTTLIILINDILDLAKVDAGKMIFVNSPFKILESISTALHLFQTKFQEKNLEFVKEYDSRIPEILQGDSIRLNQILMNLLSNAIKFTEKGKIILSVNLLNEDEKRVTLEIKVADTGIGISKKGLEVVFESFEQASTITTSLYGGTGLGLAIVKQLVERQGGTVSVKSRVDEGSVFSFTLSFQKSNALLARKNEDEQYKTEIGPVKVLIVEDVKLNQLLLRTLLDDFKFVWEIADNGKIAIEKLQTNSYDIILMDLQMPIMNGFEATEYIRNKMKLQTPIIALTADVTTADVEKCKALGMNDYISKPLDDKLLYIKIVDLIKQIPPSLLLGELAL
jgi:two-component system CheB/CheR fusion protein